MNKKITSLSLVILMSAGFVSANQEDIKTEVKQAAKWGVISAVSGALAVAWKHSSYRSVEHAVDYLKDWVSKNKEDIVQSELATNETFEIQRRLNTEALFASNVIKYAAYFATTYAVYKTAQAAYNAYQANKKQKEAVQV